MATTTTATRGKRAAETSVPSTIEGKRGIDLLHDPVLNKATAWTEAERQALGLVGLVPDATESEDIQLRRVFALARHIGNRDACLPQTLGNAHLPSAPHIGSR